MIVNKKSRFALLVLGCVFAGASFGMNNTADKNFPTTNAASASEIWQVSVGMGYTNYNDAYNGDGDVVAGRVALDFLPWHWKRLTTGFEAGVQSGNSMKLDLPCEVSYKMGGTAIDSTIKPIADFLLNFQIALNDEETAFLIAKGGAAYRYWQFDRDTVSNKSQISPELQAGFGVKITPRTKLAVYYQGIYSGDMDFKVHAIDDYCYTGSVENIPTQQGVFLSIEIGL